MNRETLNFCVGLAVIVLASVISYGVGFIFVHSPLLEIFILVTDAEGTVGTHPAELILLGFLLILSIVMSIILAFLLAGLLFFFIMGVGDATIKEAGRFTQ